MNKFKVGDRVERTAYDATGTVVKVDKDMVSVAFDEQALSRYEAMDFSVSGKDYRGLALASDNWKMVERIPNKILITTDGTTTTARLYDGKKVVKSAEAKCNATDTYDFTIGANLAYDRLMERATEVTEAPRKPESVAPKEPIATLYCVKDEPSWLTKGKTYLIGSNGAFQTDRGTPSGVRPDKGYESFEHFIELNKCWKNCLVPLVRRPARVGEWVLSLTDDYQTKGNIYKAKILDGDTGRWAYVNFDRRTRYGQGDENVMFFAPDEYLVLDGYRPEPKKYLNCKVVCTESSSGFIKQGFSYNVVDGRLTYSDGKTYIPLQFESVSALNDRTKGVCTFMEYKGEAI